LFAHLGKPNFARSGLAERIMSAAIAQKTLAALLFAHLGKPDSLSLALLNEK